MNSQVEALLNGDLDVATLPDADLRELHTALRDAFAALDAAELSDEQIVEMTRIAEATDKVQGAITANIAATEAANERVGRAEELRRRIVAPPAAPELRTPEPRVEPTPVEAPATPEVPDSPAELREPIAAAATVRPSLAELAVRAQPAPVATTRPRRIVADAVLTAAANVPGLGLGANVNWRDLSTGMLRKLELLRSTTSPEQHLCASVVWSYPEDRRLPGDAFDNSALMNTALSQRAILDSVEERGGMQAIVAGGGICGPLPIDTSIDTNASMARPLRDALPSFQAARGGLRYIPQPTLASVGTSATAVWTSANDASPSSPATKPVQEFTCPSPVDVYVDAIPTRLRFSNFWERFGPEIVAANTELAMANAARVAEINILNKLAAGSIQTGAGALVSFTRDLMALLDNLATGYRYRHRLPGGEAGEPMYPVQVVLGSWVRGAMRTDLLRELGHDRANAASDNLALTDGYIDGLFAARGVVPVWTMDGLGKSTAGATLSAAGSWDYPDQSFIAPATTAALSAAPPDASAGSASAGTWYPKRLNFFMFGAGTWVFLDGGKLDIGVIRDSALNLTNKYETFVEPFEGIAKRGFESLQVTVPVQLTGVTVAAATAPAVSALVY
jgi:hypothetical protein